MDPLKIKAEWSGEPVIVAASGPSLTPEIIRRCRLARWLQNWRVLAVNDAYKALPWADVLYAADDSWWKQHEGAVEFTGKRVTLAENEKALQSWPGIRYIEGRAGTNFSNDPQYVNLGEPEHSGFQAINLAIHLGAKRIALIGFDYRVVEGKVHFFGDHPPTLRQFGDESYRYMAKAFESTSSPIPIVNATPGSRLTVFPHMSLDDALSWDGGVHRHRAVSDAKSD